MVAFDQSAFPDPQAAMSERHFIWSIQCEPIKHSSFGLSYKSFDGCCALSWFESFCDVRLTQALFSPSRVL